MKFLNKTKAKQIAKVQLETCLRSLKLKSKGFPSPYLASIVSRYCEIFSASCSYGSVVKKYHYNTAYAYCDIRVGSYQYDQTAEGGLNEIPEDLESFDYCSLPIDTLNLNALSLTLWKLTDLKYKEAVEKYNQKESKKIRTINQFENLSSFHKLPPTTEISGSFNQNLNEKYWLKLIQTLSKWSKDLEGLTDAYFDIDIKKEVKIFTSSEKRTIIQASHLITLYVQFEKLESSGELSQQSLVIHGNSANNFGNLASIKKDLKKLHLRVVTSLNRKRLVSFSGPALLMQKPAGLLFHEAIGHRVEGSRLLSSSEGQTFKNQINKKIFNIPINIIDDPNIKTFESKDCIGNYQYDDEGSPAIRAVLVKDGILKTFLTTRAEVPKIPKGSNGHARNRSYQRPVSRMAVTLISSDIGEPISALKNKLVQEVLRQDKEFGVIIYETTGGETETSHYNFQAFSGEILRATLIDRKGVETEIRGVDLIGTPLQTLSSILAIGSDLEVDNSYCYAESGAIPITTISPAILLSSLELQAKEVELSTPYLLSPPKMD